MTAKFLRLSAAAVLLLFGCMAASPPPPPPDPAIAALGIHGVAVGPVAAPVAWRPPADRSGAVTRRTR